MSNTEKETKESKRLIDGFAINCGEYNRVITLKEGTFTIGCSSYTYDEAVAAIRDKYENKEEAEAYIQKLEECRNMNWLTDELHEQLKDADDSNIRLAVAKYSSKYHKQLKDDNNYNIRYAVAEYSDKYHEQLKDDPSSDV